MRETWTNERAEIWHLWVYFRKKYKFWAFWNAFVGFWSIFIAFDVMPENLTCTHDFLWYKSDNKQGENE